MGGKIRKRREQLGLSLRDLGKRIGKSPSLISRIEKGVEQGSLDTIRAICQELGMNLDELVNERAESQAECPECASLDRELVAELRKYPIETQQIVLELLQTVGKQSE